MKYCKKPTVVNALQFDGTMKSKNLIEDTFPALSTARYNYRWGALNYWSVHTFANTVHPVNKGDFIVEVTGGFEVWEPGEFLAAYEPVSEEVSP